MNRFLILLLTICFAGHLSQADEIYFKDGRKIEGVIRESGPNEILVETAGGVFAFKRERIDRIVERSRFENLLAQARLEETRNNYDQALDMFLQAQSLAETGEEKQSVVNGLRKSVQGFVNTLSTHDPLKNGLEDIQAIEHLKTRISDPVTLSTLQSAKVSLDNKIAQSHYNAGKRAIDQNQYGEAIKHFKVVLDNYPENPVASGLETQLAELYILQGEKEFQYGKGNLNQAESAFKEALKLDPGNNLAELYLGLIAYENENYRLTHSYLKNVSQAGLSGWQASRLQRALNRAERELAPKPTPLIARQRQPAVEEQAQEERSTSQAIGQWFGNFRSNITDLFSNAASGSTDVVPMIFSILKALGALIAVLIVFWYIPMKILLKDLPNRKIIYYNWHKIVRYTGLFGLIFYFIDRMIREKPGRKCPSCNRSLENPQLFENYEFDVCPFCNTKIKPIFTMPELIERQAGSIILAKQRSGGETDETQRQQMLELIQLIMVQGRRIRASDIHIEPVEQSLDIRYRVDGVITETLKLDRILQPFIVSSIKVMCSLDIAEKRKPQDGHFRRVIMGEDINVRVSTIPTNHGEKGVLRLLDQRMVSTTLDRLGMREETLEQYHNAVISPHGLILATGPTGSGKTTLLYSSLQFVNDGTKNIITVEDPIEYELNGINQIQHNSATGMTFANALKSILRQDPDIIMVGEIRDLETATIAVNAALTGHMVYSTLHTTDTSQTLARLIDIGVDVKLLSSALQCIVAQRLVRKLCPTCKKAAVATNAEMKRLGREGGILDGKNIYKEKGCRDCNHTGFVGRTGIYEILVPNREIRNLVEASATSLDIREASIKAGMKTLREEGIYKVLAGITSIDEIIRVTSDDLSFEEEQYPAGASTHI